MPDITFADVSEFQENFDADPYLRAGHQVIIVRAHNGYRKDNKWPARRDYVRSKPFVVVGYYQYLVAGRDAAQQARDFINTVGKLAPNEFAICDLEEGGGNQSSRAVAWFNVIDPWAGFRSTLYSGEAMFKHQLGGSASWSRPTWMAAYRSSEPTDKHTWWQNTDKARFPGLAGGVDGNIYHGTSAQFRTAVRPGGAPAEAVEAAASDHATGMRWLWPEMAPAGFH